MNRSWSVKKALGLLLLILLVFVFSLGCATTTTHYAMLGNENAYPPTEKVEILRNPPAKPYKEIAIFETHSNSPEGGSEIECIQAMAEKAKSIGADAIIIDDRRTILGGITGVGHPLNYSLVRAVAIKYAQ